MTPQFLLSVTLHKVGKISIQFESDVVRARNLASMLAQEIKFDKTSSIRIGTAVSELSRNMIEHANGGYIEFFIGQKLHNFGIVIQFSDNGPGISNLDSIQNGTYKSQHGMGIGLSGSQRLMDDFHIETSPGQGTEISIAKWLPQHAAEINEKNIEIIHQAFSKTIDRGDSSMVETIHAQNNELLFLLKKLQERNDEIESINSELEETNRGVLALNRELEDKALQIENARQQAEQANKAKSDFLARMSHEIRTPMNAILGFAELLMKTDLDSRQQQYIENVNTAGKSLLEIINDILDFSKIEAGKLDLDIVETNLIELLNQTIDIFKYSTAKKGLKLQLTIQPGIPHMVMIDPIRLKQILINLMSNAIKFTEKGTVELKVDFNPLCSERGSFHFFVSDTGIGISAEQKQRLFKAFSQADGSISRKYGGTGLGLVISNLLAEKMNSSLQLESSPGNGSTFHFTLDTYCTYEKVNPGKNGFYKKVLVYDKDQDSLQYIASHLCYWHISHDLCHTSGEALAGIKSTNYDLVMFSAETAEIIEQVTELSQHTKKPLQIVWLNDMEDQNILFQLQPDGIVLNKPLNLDELFSSINITIENYTAESTEKEENNNNTELEFKDKKTLLIAEDVEMNMLLAKMIITGIVANIEILEASTGLEAVQIVSSQAVDMILMDVQMPEMDGMEATKLIRACPDVRIKELPIIALTAGALQEERDKALDAGMNDFITKPIDQVELRQILSKYLK